MGINDSEILYYWIDPKTTTRLSIPRVNVTDEQAIDLEYISSIFSFGKKFNYTVFWTCARDLIINY